MEETFTIEQIRNYLLSQDSKGDILYNLSADAIFRANNVENDEFDDEDEFDDHEHTSSSKSKKTLSREEGLLKK